MKKLMIVLILLSMLVVSVEASVPDKPILDYPENDSELQDINIFLIVRVSDDDDDLMNVTFYNATNNDLIGYNLVNGSGKAACTWRNMEQGNYTWYANASDEINTTQSDNFTFSIVAHTKSDEWDSVYIDPDEGLGWDTIENTTQMLDMITRPFTITMGSWFYAIFMFSMVGLIYIKTQRVFIPSVILLFNGIVMVSIIPGELYGVALTMIALGFTGVVYVAFHHR